MMRLPLVFVVAMAGLGLLGGGVEAARMWMPKTTNPYCDIDTYVLRDLPEQAMSIRDSSGKPVIVVSGFTLADKPSYTQFLLAHECCHHTLGHMDRFSEQLGQVGPQRFFFIAPALKQMELDADCCAVKMLRSRNETGGIEAAEEAMIVFGTAQTGAHYPTGNERVENMAKCAAQD
ncbi:MAG TPA: hypothetical protein VFY74_00175 [Methyloceanibacter sp.]|jgi:hypothetical protein|nr:hypothetical protein [Methyloceanibacter sp.]